MNFHSPEYAALFLAVFLLYFNLPPRLRPLLLLAASATFYMWWRPDYILLILFSVTIDYGVALGLDRPGSPPGRRRFLLAVSLVTNLGLLFFFKYYGLAVDSLRALFAAIDRPFTPPLLDVLLPVGISFYTFQALSYTIDVYRGEIRAERRFLRLCLYVLFFPQLVAGPIERSGRLLPQFDEPHAFDAERASSGFRLILWGLVKKVAVADRLALLADSAYASPSDHSGAALLVATYAFAFQIYADFSAYSDIALGSARVLGYRLMLNFDRPYLATSPVDFWRRWHISLSTWFRDYLYIPLGGSKAGRGRWLFAILATFFLSGIWHGARWTFAAWGAYHGLLVVLTRLLERSRLPRPPVWARALVTFHLVLAGWVLFRAATFRDAAHVFARALDFSDGRPLAQRMDLAPGDFLAAGLGVALLLAADLLKGRRVTPWPAPVRWAAYAAGTLVVLNARMPVENPFIYFQF